MAVGRTIFALAGLASACAASAAPRQIRLPFDLAALETGPEVSYHPSRWLTIRRSIAFVRLDPAEAAASAARASAPRRGGYAMVGDIHPFGSGWRVSFGVRESANRRLLRYRGDAAEIGTARYAPAVSLGYAGQLSPGVAFGVDAGVTVRPLTAGHGSVLLTPVDQALPSRDGARAYGIMLQLSAAHHF